MKLSYQKVIEIGPMQVRISFLLDRVYSNYPHNWHEIVMNNQKDLNDYKIRLENLLCETDDKEKYNKKSKCRYSNPVFTDSLEVRKKSYIM